MENYFLQILVNFLIFLIILAIFLIVLLIMLYKAYVAFDPKKKILRTAVCLIGLYFSVKLIYLYKIGYFDKLITTHNYRSELIQNSVSLEGKDIDHIIPKNMGGADHPLNYQVISSYQNRAWQDGHIIDKALSNPLEFIGALIFLVSLFFPPLVPIVGIIGVIFALKKLKEIWTT